MADYYVSNTGDDGATGLVGFPWQTINKVNISSFNAGDTISLNKGDTWAEQLTIPSSGESENHITIGAYGTGAAPIIDGGDARSYCINTNSKNYLTFDGLHVKRGTSHNIYIPSSSSVTVQNCTSESGGSTGLYAGDDNSTIIIDTNTFHSNGNGISFSTGLTSSEIKNNTIYSNSDQGIYTDSGITVESNVIYSNGTSAALDHGLYASTSAANMIVRYNHSYDNASIGLLSSGDDTQMYYNISHHNTKGIQTSGGTGHKYFNNVCYANGSGNVGHGISIQGSATVAEIKNNILVANYGAVDLYTGQINIGASATLTASDYNIIYGDGTASQDLCTDEAGSPKYTFAEWQGAGYDANSIEDDPEFVNAGGSFALDTDYLIESDSPAIDAGVDVSLSTDYFENDVHAGIVEDIGAHEYPLGGGGETIYYVDATTGSDDDSGLTAALAWETVAKVNGESFSAGDYILFKRGEEWREQLTIPDSGSNGSPIVFGTYGSGEQPIINGADLVSTWTEYGAWQTAWDVTYDSTWSATGTRNYRNIVPANISSYSGTKIRITAGADGGNGVITGSSIGLMTTLDDFDSAPTRITWDTGSSSTTINDGTTKTSDEITFTFDKTKRYGLHFYLAEREYLRYDAALEDGLYHNSVASDDTLTQAVAYGTWEGVGVLDLLEVYVSQANVWQATLTTEPDVVYFDSTAGNEQSALVDVDSDKDWFWDSNVLYVYSTGDPDDDYSDPGIEASIRTQSILSSGKDYITIENLHLKHSVVGIKLYDGADYNIIQDCTIRYCGNKGIKLQGDNTIITNCTIRRNDIRYVQGGSGTAIYGIHINGVDGSTQSTGNTIENNTIQDVTKGAFYLRYADSNVLRYNECHGTGESNIHLNESDSNEVYYNLLDHDGDNNNDYHLYVYNGSIGNAIYNNVIINNGNDSGLYCDATSAGTQFKNNIYTGSGRCIIIADGAETNFASDYNCMDVSGGTYANWRGTNKTTFANWKTDSSQDANSIDVDPLMTDPANDDFTLQFGSPCINRGAHVGLTTDYTGTAHVPIGHQPDIGAYEHKDGSNVVFL